MDDTPSPRYYRPGELRAIRDDDRRYYRSRTILLIAYVFIIAIGVRFTIDFVVLENPAFKQIHFIKPYVLPGMAGMITLVWACGIWVIFRRKY